MEGPGKFFIGKLNKICLALNSLESVHAGTANTVRSFLHFSRLSVLCVLKKTMIENGKENSIYLMTENCNRLCEPAHHFIPRNPHK